ncbi:hypothetical protein I4U23_022068 [Adineta vaga]|nr:hypothetical protein I4U23_022068 [Adineta vaga]
MSTYEKFIELWKKIKIFLVNFNLFKSIPPSTNDYQLRNEIISTRLFILLLCISLTISTLYTSLITNMKTIKILTPSYIDYLQLYSTHSQTLSCPCQTISINYEKIVYIDYTLHQLCSSIFVSDQWIDYLNTASRGIEVDYQVFPAIGTYSFQALRGFCQLINQTILGGLVRFNSNQYISGSVISKDLFQSQISASIDHFKSSMIKDFLVFLNTIRRTTQANTLVSAVQSNYLFEFLNDTIPVLSSWITYGNCSCASTSTCIYPLISYISADLKRFFTIPGFYRGCHIIEALLQSDLPCFYDQICINKAIYIFQFFSPSLNIIPLNSSLLNKYLINSTIQELLNEFMIEEWNWTAVHKDYYNYCQPTYCTYTIEKRNDYIYIITTVIGLIGGLVTVLKFTIPLIVRFVSYCIRKWMMKVVPTT